MSTDPSIDKVTLNAELTALESSLQEVMMRDAYRLGRQYRELHKRFSSGKPIDQGLGKLRKAIEKSSALVEQRLKAIPKVAFPENLPISAKREAIAELIDKHQVVVLAGETGSGKTTQLPKICLDLGRGIKGLIGHTQPRRIAARTVASRIAEELETPLGESVGYQVRFTDHSTPTSHIKLMTDGILLAEIQNDRYLNKYDTLIIDEAHERSLNIDFLLGYIKQILPKRPDLKVIITSATIDLERFSKHFDDAPIIEVSGRTYPVDVLYRPMADSAEDLNSAIIGAIEEIEQLERLNHQRNGEQRRGGDILIFMSGEREIREAALAIRRADFKHLDVLPLYARLSLAEQNKVFQSHKGRRVVLATNVAETSITVPGIRYVIDPGTARISRYSYRTKVQRLPIESISQASANQRKGRCGRVSEGVCIRLYDEQDFINRSEFTDAEILRTNLAAVILQMLNLRIGDIHDFPFVDPPDQRLINDGFKLLQELQAVNKKGELTKTGRLLMKLPIDPRLGRMLVAAKQGQCVSELLIILSALSVQDPRERPADKQQAADEKHRRFYDDHSDFMAYINLWHYVEEQRQELSQNQFRKQCKREFLSYLRLREWRDIHHQLRLAAKDLELTENKQPAGYEAVHRALVTGLLGQVGFKAEEREYLGARNRRFEIFPGSSQKKKRPKWLVSAQLLETSKLFAHTVAKIEPEWIQQAAQHLVKRRYFEPHYNAKSGQVMAYESISLYGLVLVEKKRVSYSQINPEVSREVFIREALVEGLYRGKGKFYQHNEQLIEELDVLEAKSRRRDILADDEVLFGFYNERVPQEIVNLAGFEHWRKEAESSQPKLLYIDRETLMRHDASAVTEAQFPDELQCDGMRFPLVYHFEPGHPDDGVSLQSPVAALHLLPENRLQWLVPGILREKCIAMVKALPKQWRKNFVPVPEYVDKALASMSADNTPLHEALAFQLKRHTSIEIPADTWDLSALDNYYRMNIQVVDERGKIIDRDRDLTTLRDRYRDQLQQTLQSDDDGLERDGITSWELPELPDHNLVESIPLSRAGMTISAYPALIDCGDSVSLKLLDNPVDAEFDSRQGITRLLLLGLGQTLKSLRKELLKGKDIGLTVVSLGKRDQVVDQILLAAIHHCALAEQPLVRTKVEFEHRLNTAKSTVTGYACELEKLLVDSLTQVVAIKKTIKSSKNALAIALAATDINCQLEQLFYPGFLYATSMQWLRQYPRYLKAITLRLDKVASQIQKDKIWMTELDEFWLKWEQNLEKQGPALVASNPELQQFRWMLEEYRVSLFAQSLKTLMPVSAKRLNKQWQLAMGQL
ncbi:ATP-dependent RNA helicase HrpA [Maricurvus nonylphenolicus]|uniref:ATP-dependent RNA helicase HrpA n=1 Tax=Maricurvus nonylphenolicus TaxID=1008307 RepID=UPI0036F22755